uniref:C-type lectin domain-containing protein n=1 Tax=Strigamia maritima TaxID=126957 RepID=T1IUA7_STRMM
MNARTLSFVFAICCLWNVSNACTDGFVHLELDQFQGCYFFSENLVTWLDAYTHCSRLNSQLLSIETIEESFAINLHMSRKHGRDVTYYWTSGSDAYQQGRYIWMSNGKPLSYTNWCANEPNDENGFERCIHLNYLPNGMFAICWLWNVTNACPDGFISLHQGCYLFSTQAVIWVDAFKHCATLDSQLVSIETVEESFAINLHLYYKHGQTQVSYWTSGSDAYQEDDYIWMSKGKPFTYSNWCANEPNNDGNEDCIHLNYYPSGTTCWNDAKCWSYNRLFICEKEQ